MHALLYLKWFAFLKGFYSLRLWQKFPGFNWLEITGKVSTLCFPKSTNSQHLQLSQAGRSCSYSWRNSHRTQSSVNVWSALSTKISIYCSLPLPTQDLKNSAKTFPFGVRICFEFLHGFLGQGILMLRSGYLSGHTDCPSFTQSPSLREHGDFLLQ